MRTPAIVMLAMLAACGTVVDVVPMRGPAPDMILVVPPRRVIGAAETDSLAPAFARALAARGYTVESGETAVERLASLGWSAESHSVVDLPLEELADRYGVGAVWIIDVDRWRFVDAPGRPFEYDLTCSLVATRDGSPLWLWRFDGSERSMRRQKGVDPFADRDPFQAENPVPWVVRTHVADVRELTELVAHNVALRLPVR